MIVWWFSAYPLVMEWTRTDDANKNEMKQQASLDLNILMISLLAKILKYIYS